MIVIDEKKDVKIAKDEVLQARIDANYNLLIRKKGSKKDFEWIIGLVNSFDVYCI